MSFSGGSSWSMVRDIADGYVTVTVRTFARFNDSELRKLGFEFEKKLREVRSRAPDLDDTQALQQRNREILRLTSARRILSGYLSQTRRG